VKEGKMSWEYCCPRCKASLNPDRSIILRMSRGDVDCLIGLHPQPGKYEVYLPPKVTTEDGTVWDFACPLCGEALMCRNEPNLCRLDLKVDGESVKILFSRVAGEHATFVLHEDKPEERFGEDAERYVPKDRKAVAGGC
jgi:hypothetical protein